MPKIKPHLENLYRSKTDEKSRRGYLCLDMNEGVHGLPENFLRKTLSKIDSRFLYTYPDYRVVTDKIASHNNLGYENIILSNGSDAAIKYIFDAYVSAGNSILLTDPTFAMYPVYCRMFNANPEMVAYKDDLSFPKEEFLRHISKDITLVAIVNPNNPTGSVVEQGELVKIIRKAAEQNILIVVDEAYFYFRPDTIIGAVKEYKNLIVLRTFSKLCAIASARIGYAAACPEIINNLKKVRPSYDINGLAVLIAEKILDNPDIIEDLILSVKEGKKFLIKKLSEAKIEYQEGCANFVLIKCFDKVGEIMEGLVERNILVAGRFEQAFLKDYIRVTVGHRPVMEQFWKAFIDIFKAKMPYGSCQ